MLCSDIEIDSLKLELSQILWAVLPKKDIQRADKILEILFNEGVYSHSDYLELTQDENIKIGLLKFESIKLSKMKIAVQPK